MKLRKIQSTLGGSGNLHGGVETRPDAGILEHFRHEESAGSFQNAPGYLVKGDRAVVGGGPEQVLDLTRKVMESAGLAVGGLTTGEVRTATEILDYLNALEPGERERAVDLLLHGFVLRPSPRPELQAEAKREVLRRRIARLKAAKAGLEAELEEITGPFDARRADIIAEMVVVAEPELLRAARDWQCPPGPPKTAANMDLLSMNVARYSSVQAKLFTNEAGVGVRDEDAQFILANVARRYPALARVLDRASGFYNSFDGPDNEAAITLFHEKWFKSAFARLEVGHKLAAALALTDVPDDVEVRAPWEAWSLVLPDGLLPELPHPGQIARVWVVGTQPVFGIATSGMVLELGRFKDPAGERYLGVVENLIRGACLALSNPDDFKKERSGAPASKSSKQRSGPPELEQARFLLSAPVKIDLREHLASYLTGRKGLSPTVQFLVRGHWRNQVHGKGRLLRKTVWIAPFWKGPEESRVLLRQHQVVTKGDG